MIRCPACRNDMEEKLERGVAVDRCVHCGAFWFDAEELRAYVGDSAEHASLPRESASRDSGLVCPRCPDSRLARLSLERVVLQPCPRCGGIFVGPESVLAIQIELHPDRYSAVDAAVDVAINAPDLVGDVLGFLLDGLSGL